MAHQLTFAQRRNYDTRLEGVSIEATLISGEHLVICQAKIDTGGEVCLFMREIADTLDIDVPTGYRKTFATLAGSLVAYGHEITVRTFDIEFDSLVYFAADYGLPRNLLGREGWLQKVRLGIVDYEAAIYLSAY